MIAIKTERTQIHFLSDVLVAVASLDLKVPFVSGWTRRREPFPLFLLVQSFRLFERYLSQTTSTLLTLSSSLVTYGIKTN